MTLTMHAHGEQPGKKTVDIRVRKCNIQIFSNLHTSDIIFSCNITVALFLNFLLGDIFCCSQPTLTEFKGSRGNPHCMRLKEKLETEISKLKDIISPSPIVRSDFSFAIIPAAGYALSQNKLYLHKIFLERFKKYLNRYLD